MPRGKCLSTDMRVMVVKLYSQGYGLRKIGQIIGITIQKIVDKYKYEGTVTNLPVRGGKKKTQQMIVNKIRNDPKSLASPKYILKWNLWLESQYHRKLSEMCYAGRTIMTEWLEINPSSASSIVKRDLNLQKCTSTSPKNYGTTSFGATRVNSTSSDRTGANWFGGR
jgi:transposase